MQIDKDNTAPDTYSFTNALFWGVGKGRDFAVSCSQGEKACRPVVGPDFSPAAVEIDVAAAIPFECAGEQQSRN